MAWDEEEFPLVRMHKDVYEAYVELVDYYRYINRKDSKRSVIKHLLIETFEEKLTALKAEHQVSVCRTSKSGIKLTHQQNQVINKLNKEYYINEWDNEQIYLAKIPHDSFVEIVKDCFKVVGRDAITNRKKEILDLIGFKQVREGNSWFVVHKNYIPKKNTSKEIKVTGENKFRVNRIFKALENGNISQENAFNELKNNSQRKYLEYLMDGGSMQ